MPSATRSFALAAAAAAAASATSLADVCTSDYVSSSLPTDIEGITIDASSLTVNPVYNASVTAGNLYVGGSGFNYCNVTVAYARDGLSDASSTNVWYYLPAPGQWKGRYLTTGGGGFAITSGTSGLENGLPYGAVSGTTDGGFGGWDNELTDVILKANGTVDTELLWNFGYRSIHELTVIGQELAKNFYDTDSLRSYYQGCSEGGREGWSQVQRYADQFDGAAIGAPAFRMPFQQVAHLTSGVIEKTVGYAPSSCELERILNDTIAACDPLDGRTDGVVSRADLCGLNYNASASIGNTYSCSSSMGSPAANGTVSAKAAEVAEKIWAGLFDSEGRQIYVSFLPAASFSDGAASYNSETGEYEADASGIAVSWINYFLKKIESDSMSLDNVTYDTLRDWMYEGYQEYSDTVQSTWPDLTDFKASGGKVIHFHGESDSSVPPLSSVHYHDQVRQIMYPNLGFNESYDALHEFYRLFLVPGAEHCAPSSTQANGPFPQNVLQSVIDWVENGTVPETLPGVVLDGTTSDVDQKICAFPLRPLWKNNSTMECVFDQAGFEYMTPTLDSFPMPVY